MKKPKKEVTPFLNRNGGADLLLRDLVNQGIPEKIDALLGKRNARAEYSYGEVITTWIMNVLCGARRLEHVHENKTMLLKNPYFKKGISPDTVSRVFRKLSVRNIYYSKGHHRYRSEFVSNPTEEQKEKFHEVNNNYRLNNLVLDIAMELGVFKKGEAYELDIDATIIENEISDTRLHYKLTGKGYCPVVVMLGGIPIYVESRNGNSNAAFRLTEVLESAIDLFESKGLKIKLVRSDAAGSNKYVINYLMEKKIDYFIRATEKLRPNSQKDIVWDKFESRKNLNTLLTGSTHCWVDGSEIRQVAYRMILRDGTEGKEWSILTSNENMASRDVIDVYNVRAFCEQRFTDLNHLGWNRLPHREMMFNTVYLHITILAYLIFVYAKHKISKKVKFVRENMELMSFIKSFINVITRWVGRRLQFLERSDEYRKLADFG